MKIYNLILVIAASLFFCCTKERSSAIPSKNNVENYLKKASDTKLSYQLRKKYNQKVLIALLKESNDSSNRGKIYKVAWQYFRMNCWKDLKTTSNILLNKSLEKGDNQDLAKSYRLLGVSYESISFNDSAFYFYTKAERIYIDTKNDRGLCTILQDKAQVQYYVNDYLGNELSLVKALKIAKKFNLEFEQYKIYLSLGWTSLDMQDFEKADELFNKALISAGKTEKKRENLCPTSFCLNSLGSNYFYLGDVKKAILVYEHALKNKQLKNKQPILFCRLLDNLGNAKTELKNYKGVLTFFYTASKIRDSLNIDLGRNFNKLYLSEYYIQTKDTLNAKRYANEAYQLSKSFRAPNDILLSLKQLSKVDPSNALKYSSEYIKISDSMHQLERETRNKFAKIAYETEEITNEKETAIHQKWIFMGITILVFIVGLLLVMVVSQRIKQKDLQFTQEQQKNNEEIYQLIQSRQAKINEGRHTEKQRIARDLHDGIMNRLAATRLNLHMLNENSDPQTIKKCLPFIDGIQNIEKEIRNIAHDLNKDVFSDNDSFIPILESLFEEQKAISNIKCHLEIDPKINWNQVESSIKIDIYRIFQEALNNTNKHADAQVIVASILKRDDNLLLEIYDDGIGFSLNGKKKGIGLQNIYSRTKAFNGTIEIKSKKNEGTALIIAIPIKSNT